MNTNPEPQATKPECNCWMSGFASLASKCPAHCDDSIAKFLDETEATPAPEPPASEQWEYETTSGPRKAWSNSETPPKGDGWIRDKSRGCNGFERFDYHEESYWKRPISTPTGKESDEECATRLQPEVAASVETQNATSALVTSDAAPSGPIPEGAAMSHEVAIGEPQDQQCSTGEPQSALPSAGSETPRTDAALITNPSGAMIARTLERELTAARAELEESKEAYRLVEGWYKEMLLSKPVEIVCAVREQQELHAIEIGGFYKSEAKLRAEVERWRNVAKSYDDSPSRKFREEYQSTRAELETAKARIKELERDLCQIDPDKLTEQRDKLRADIARVTAEKDEAQKLVEEYSQDLMTNREVNAEIHTTLIRKTTNIASWTDEGLPVDLDEPCLNCGFRRGSHRMMTEQCPISEHHVEWRDTKFLPQPPAGESATEGVR